MSAAPNVFPLTHEDRRGLVALQRKALHRFLVAYLTTRNLPASPTVRALLIAGIDVYPGPFPMRQIDLESHLDAVLRLRLAQRPGVDPATAFLP